MLNRYWQLALTALAANRAAACTQASDVNLDLLVLTQGNSHFEYDALPYELETWQRTNTELFRSLRVGLGTVGEEGASIYVGLTPNATHIGNFRLPTPQTTSGSFLQFADDLQSFNNAHWTLLPRTNTGSWRNIRVIVAAPTTTADKEKLDDAWVQTMEHSDAYAVVVTDEESAESYASVAKRSHSHRARVLSIDNVMLGPALSRALDDVFCSRPAEKHYTKGHAIDLLFAVDNTVSMGRFGTALTEALPSVVERLQDFGAAVAPALISFNDKPCDTGFRQFAPVNYCARVESAFRKDSADGLIEELGKLKYIYGGTSSREDAGSALNIASKIEWHKGANKYAVVVSDARPHEASDAFECGLATADSSCAKDPYVDLETVCKDLKGKDIRVLYVTVNSQLKANHVAFPGCNAVHINALSLDHHEVTNAIVRAITADDLKQDGWDGNGGEEGGEQEIDSEDTDELGACERSEDDDDDATTPVPRPIPPALKPTRPPKGDETPAVTLQEGPSAQGPTEPTQGNRDSTVADVIQRAERGIPPAENVIPPAENVKPPSGNATTIGSACAGGAAVLGVVIMISKMGGGGGGNAIGEEQQYEGNDPEMAADHEQFVEPDELFEQVGDEDF